MPSWCDDVQNGGAKSLKSCDGTARKNSDGKTKSIQQSRIIMRRYTEAYLNRTVAKDRRRQWKVLARAIEAQGEIKLPPGHLEERPDGPYWVPDTKD